MYYLQIFVSRTIIIGDQIDASGSVRGSWNVLRRLIVLRLISLPRLIGFREWSLLGRERSWRWSACCVGLTKLRCTCRVVIYRRRAAASLSFGICCKRKMKGGRGKKKKKTQKRNEKRKKNTIRTYLNVHKYFLISSQTNVIERISAYSLFVVV